MPAPEVLIDVEAETGIWRTDGVPMVYTPRMFLVNMQRTMEEALGEAEYRRAIHASSETSAMQWCRDQAATQGLVHVADARRVVAHDNQLELRFEREEVLSHEAGADGVAACQGLDPRFGPL